MKRAGVAVDAPVRLVFETFRTIGRYEQSNLTRTEPSCFNQSVEIKKYRVTVEEIDEPKEVLEARLRKLWSETKNHHDWQPLQNAAEKLGITLTHEDRRNPSNEKSSYPKD